MSAVASPLQLQFIFRIKFPLYEGLPRLPEAVDLAVRHNLHVGACRQVFQHQITISPQVSDWGAHGPQVIPEPPPLPVHGVKCETALQPTITSFCQPTKTIYNSLIRKGLTGSLSSWDSCSSLRQFPSMVSRTKQPICITFNWQKHICISFNWHQHTCITF